MRHENDFAARRRRVTRVLDDRRILDELHAGAISAHVARKFVVRQKLHRTQIKASSTARSQRAAEALAKLDALGGADALCEQGWSWDRIAAEVNVSSTWLRRHLRR